MKKSKTFISLAAMAALSFTANAQLNGTGYYRITNNYTDRYIYVIDNTGSLNYSTTTADMGAIDLWKAIDRTLYDPATVLYCQQISGKQYDIKSQGTGIYQMIGFYVTLTTDPRVPDAYVAYGSAHGMTKYLFDAISSGTVDRSFLSDNGKNECKYWQIKPITADGDNYFGVKSTISTSNGEYYAPFYAEFPFSFASSGMKACYITKVDTQRGYAVYKEITGSVPGATPMFIKCNSENHSDNRLNIGGTANAVNDNIGVGVYFNSEKAKHINQVAYNPQTMRVLGKMADGSLGLVTESFDFVPRNTFYVNVPAGAPAQFQIVSESEYEEILASIPVDATGITLSESALTMTVGETMTLTANVLPAEATNRTVTWTSSNTSVATVDTNGSITAAGIGTTTITATTHNGYSATCQVTVTPVMPASVTLSQTNLPLLVGASATLTATVLPENAADKTVTWTTDNANVAVVSAAGVVTAKADGTANITAQTVNGIKAVCQVTVTSIAATSVTLDKTSLSLYEGEVTTLTATVLPADATYKNITWTTDNASVATVDASGHVTAKSTGTATVTATTHNGLKATCSVSVYKIDPESVTVTPDYISLFPGMSRRLTATVLPANATDKSVTWTAADENIVTVDADGNVTGVGVGETMVTATTHNGKTSSCRVVVIPVVAESVTVTPDYISLFPGMNRRLTATVLPENTTNKSVVWTTGDPSVVTVDADGNVTGVGVGETTVTATTHNGKTSSCRVVVIPVVAESVTVTPDYISLFPGMNRRLTATVLPENTTNKSVVWTTGDPSVVTVDADGNVTGVGVGETTVTATTHNGKTSSCRVVVIPVLPTDLTLNETSMTLTVDDVFVLTATVAPEDTTDPAVYFTSSDPAVASVNNDGVVTALKGGTAIIEARCFTVVATCLVTVNKKSQSITWIQDFGEVYDGDQIVLLAEASSGLDVRYEVSDNAAVEGNVLTVLTPGEVKVKALQDGDERHEAAEPVEMSFSALAGISDAKYDTVRVDVEGSSVVVSGKPADAKVYVYAMSGLPVYSGTGSRISLQSHSAYIVVVGNRNFKIFTK